MLFRIQSEAKDSRKIKGELRVILSVTRDLIYDAEEQNILVPGDARYFSLLPMRKGLGIPTCNTYI